jgi:Fn3 associated
MEFGQRLSIQINPGYIMKSITLLFLLSISAALIAQDTFQLAPPLVKYNSVFFADKTMVEIKFAQSGTAVHYTLNNQEPTVKDLIYAKPIAIKNNFTTLKVKAFGNNFHPSQTVATTFFKTGKKVLSVQQTTPDKDYPGGGVNTLIDNKGGIPQFGSNTWLGYNCDTVTIAMNLEKEQTIDKVLMHFLQDEGSWIFMPDEIIILWFDKKLNAFNNFGSEKLLADTATPGSRCSYRIIQAKNKIQTSKILLNIIVKKTIPAWHPGKGEHGWLFIDEIKVY